MMFEQYFSLIKIFAVILSQAFPHVFATFIYLCTYEREKLCVGIHICYQKTNRLWIHNTSCIIKMLLFAFMQMKSEKWLASHLQ